jgi:hypothetical protein
MKRVKEDKESRFRLEDTLVKWAVATFFGGALDAALIYAIIAMYYPITESLFGMAALGTIVIVVPILYSVLATHLLPDKRFVSPFAQVMVTAALVIGQTMLTLRPPYTNQSGYVLLTSFALIYLILMSYGADLVAKYIAGLGGGQDTHKRTLTASVQFPALLKIVDDEEDLRKASSKLLKKRELSKGKVSVYRNEDSNYRFFLAMAENPKNPDQTLMHFEAYLIGDYVIHTTDTTNLIFDRDTAFFEKTLREKHGVEFGEAHYDMMPLRRDIDAIILEPTGSRITSLAALPKRTILVMFAFLVLGVIAYALRATNQITQNDFLSLLVVSLGPLLVSLIPFVRGPAKREQWIDA